MDREQEAANEQADEDESMSEWSEWGQEYETWRMHQLLKEQDASYESWVKETEQGKRSEQIESCKKEQLETSPTREDITMETIAAEILAGSPETTPSKQKRKKSRKDEAVEPTNLDEKWQRLRTQQGTHSHHQQPNEALHQLAQQSVVTMKSRRQQNS